MERRRLALVVPDLVFTILCFLLLWKSRYLSSWLWRAASLRNRRLSDYLHLGCPHHLDLPLNEELAGEMMKAGTSASLGLTRIQYLEILSTFQQHFKCSSDSEMSDDIALLCSLFPASGDKQKRVCLIEAQQPLHYWLTLFTGLGTTENKRTRLLPPTQSKVYNLVLLYSFSIFFVSTCNRWTWDLHFQSCTLRPGQRQRVLPTLPRNRQEGRPVLQRWGAGSLLPCCWIHSTQRPRRSFWRDYHLSNKVHLQRQGCCIAASRGLCAVRKGERAFCAHLCGLWKEEESERIVAFREISGRGWDEGS